MNSTKINSIGKEEEALKCIIARNTKYYVDDNGKWKVFKNEARIDNGNNDKCLHLVHGLVFAATYFSRKDRYPLGKLKPFSLSVCVCVGSPMCFRVASHRIHSMFYSEFLLRYIMESMYMYVQFSNEKCSALIGTRCVFVGVMVSRRRRAHFNVGRSGFLFTLILIVLCIFQRYLTFEA